MLREAKNVSNELDQDVIAGRPNVVCPQFVGNKAAACAQGSIGKAPPPTPVIVEPTSGCIRPVGRILARRPQPETLELHGAHGLVASVANEQRLSPFQVAGQVQA